MNSQDKNSGSKRKKARAQNPIEAALLTWFQSHPLEQHDRDQLVAQAPKRWVVYEPMALLPTGAFGSAAWHELLGSSIDKERVDQLWRAILAEISKKQKAQLTHLAVNEGIPLRSTDTAAAAASGDGNSGENILRSPSGLRMLYGDFGPSTVSLNPSTADFEAAFWVSTRQNGILQTWAPRWTMFSRGNVKEKARLLDFHHINNTTTTTTTSNPTQEPPASPAHRSKLAAATDLRRSAAVDLYAGIGYFVFSYARLGLRVLCWELNPWSAEGLRRGARGNGWGVRVAQAEDPLSPSSSARELLAGGGGEQIVVFLEDNARAARRIAELRRQEQQQLLLLLDVLHVNCGLLPRSDASWESAWDIVAESKQAWLHLHENVGVADIEGRRGEIERWFGELAKRDGCSKTAYVDHVEQVKTFAPGVWHCVFDLYITTSDHNIT